MNKDERSLLLFLETCATDQGGLVDTSHMNNNDELIVKKFCNSHFIEFGRICFDDIEKMSHGLHKYTHWVNLSPDAEMLAYQERSLRAARMWNKRTWKKTDELES
jgi:hypothetical protein